MSAAKKLAPIVLFSTQYRTNNKNLWRIIFTKMILLWVLRLESILDQIIGIELLETSGSHRQITFSEVVQEDSLSSIPKHKMLSHALMLRNQSKH